MRAACSDAFPAAPSSRAASRPAPRGGTQVSGVRAAGGKLFYGKRDPGENTVKLYVRDGVAGAERLLVDPDKMAVGGGPHYALDYYEPSARRRAAWPTPSRRAAPRPA